MFDCNKNVLPFSENIGTGSKSTKSSAVNVKTNKDY